MDFHSNRHGPFLLIRLPKYLGPVALESGCEKHDGRWARGGCKEKRIVRNGTEFTV